MSSRKAIVSAAASIVTALALVGCGESSVSETNNGTMSAEPGNLDTWANDYSYSQPENSYGQPAENAADRSQPAGATMHGDTDDDR